MATTEPYCNRFSGRNPGPPSVGYGPEAFVPIAVRTEIGSSLLLKLDPSTYPNLAERYR